MSEYIDRLKRAEDAIGDKIKTDPSAVERIRLRGKREGIRLARSYAEETRPEHVSEGLVLDVDDLDERERAAYDYAKGILHFVNGWLVEGETLMADDTVEAMLWSLDESEMLLTGWPENTPEAEDTP